ncbi:MAG: matrixin family metalloprotease [Deltaproteobacteria bacterium]|nr:matrixin family metalloprotease [Deltaproteobacteria bacterium]
MTPMTPISRDALRRSAAAAALAFCWLLPATAGAFSISLSGGTTGQIVRWKQSTVGYWLHPACSADLSTSVCLDELRKSFAAWNTSCTKLKFSDQGTSSSKQLVPIGYSTNGKNELAFIENSAWNFGSQVLGVTSPVFSSDGTIIEADIAFNGYLQSWKTSGANYSTDVRNVAVHEIGHFFGLQHVLGGYNPNSPPTMAPFADPFMKSRTPEADDLAGICFLYPAGSFSCSSDTDCPLVVDDNAQGAEYYVGQVPCQANGSCGGFSTQLPTGSGALGDVCASDFDCTSKYFCQPLSGSSGACAQDCSPSASNCPSGFACYPYQNQPSAGVCLKGGGGGATKAIGEACANSAECQSQLCVSGSTGAFCRQACSGASGCPTGQTCSPLPSTSIGACTDATPVTPKKELGETCQSQTECASNLCASDGASFRCTQPCTTVLQCGQGQACSALSGGGGGCFDVDEKEVGEPCDSQDSVCKSGQCVSFDKGASYICSDVCQVDSHCPCGMYCAAVTTGSSRCAPGPKVACVPDSQPCSADSECVSGVCSKSAGVCIQVCSIYQPVGACGPDSGCQPFAPGAPEGECKPAGPNAVGAACGKDNACQTLFCKDNHCAQPCNPAGPSTCGVGLVCLAEAGAVGTCQPPPPPVPDAAPEAGPDAASSTGDAVSAVDGVGPSPDGVNLDAAAGAETSSLAPSGASSGGCAGGGAGGGPAGLALIGLLLAALRRRRHFGRRLLA